MHKSRHVIYHQDKLKSYRRWKHYKFYKKRKHYKFYKKVIHNFKQFDMVRFPRRIARWRAMILQFGGRTKII